MKLNMVAKEYGRREHTVMNLRSPWGKNAQSSIKGCIKSSRLSHKQGAASRVQRALTATIRHATAYVVYHYLTHCE